MKIRLLVSSDIHGAIMPYKYSDLKEINYGFLKLKETMREYITNHTIVIDNGDILEGSALTTYYHKYHYHFDPILKCMNNFVDYYNVGNHDFNFGISYLKDFISHFNGICLTGNIKYQNEYLGKEYHIHEFDKNNRIALIGITTHFIKYWEKPSNLKDTQIEDAYDYLKKTIEKIKKTEDIKAIVVIYHGGYERNFDGSLKEIETGENQAYKILKEIKDIDILITGHQHLSLKGKCLNVLTSQTLANAQEFALYDYDLDLKEGSVEIIKTTKIANQDELNIFMDLENKLDKWLDTPLGYIKNYDLRIEDEFLARKNKHPLLSFINQVQLDASNAMLSGNALFNDVKGFNHHITMRDLISAYYYPNTIIILEINGKILRTYLEKNAEYFDIKNDEIVINEHYLNPQPLHFNYDMVDGIDYTIKVSNPINHRIIDLKYQGKDINDDDIFTLALTNYRASGGGNFTMFKDAKRIKEIQTDMITLISEYLLKHKEIDVIHKDNIKVIY